MSLALFLCAAARDGVFLEHSVDFIKMTFKDGTSDDMGVVSTRPLPYAERILVDGMPPLQSDKSDSPLPVFVTANVTITLAETVESPSMDDTIDWFIGAMVSGSTGPLPPRGGTWTTRNGTESIAEENQLSLVMYAFTPSSDYPVTLEFYASATPNGDWYSRLNAANPAKSGFSWAGTPRDPTEYNYTICAGASSWGMAMAPYETTPPFKGMVSWSEVDGPARVLVVAGPEAAAAAIGGGHVRAASVLVNSTTSGANFSHTIREGLPVEYYLLVEPGKCIHGANASIDNLAPLPEVAMTGRYVSDECMLHGCNACGKAESCAWCPGAGACLPTIPTEVPVCPPSLNFSFQCPDEPSPSPPSDTPSGSGVNGIAMAVILALLAGLFVGAASVRYWMLRKRPRHDFMPLHNEEDDVY